MAYQQIQQRFPIQRRGNVADLRQRELLQFPKGRPLNVATKNMLDQCSPGPDLPAGTPQQTAYQFPYLMQQIVMVDPQPVPFQQRVFRVVPLTQFPGPEGFTDLEDVAAARRQQPLHGIFR